MSLVAASRVDLRTCLPHLNSFIEALTGLSPVLLSRWSQHHVTTSKLFLMQALGAEKAGGTDIPRTGGGEDPPTAAAQLSGHLVVTSSRGSSSTGTIVFTPLLHSKP